MKIPRVETIRNELRRGATPTVEQMIRLAAYHAGSLHPKLAALLLQAADREGIRRDQIDQQVRRATRRRMHESARQRRARSGTHERPGVPA